MSIYPSHSRSCRSKIPCHTLLAGFCIAVFLCFFPSSSSADMPEPRDPLAFTLHKKGDGNGPTLMVVGGIQGDEPGAFSAASLLVTHYNILSGNVWVVPNLNLFSIVRRSRGVRGDLNRKFAFIAPNDPDKAIIQRIKPILLHESVDLILNMHDGSGFYRPKWQNSMRNPKRWGQSIIVDQARLPGTRFPYLEKMATDVAENVNKRLLEPDHKYHVKNTKTAEGDLEMAKTLTYFAVTHGKPAFGQEASKDFDLITRVYYHLLILESFMQKLGIRFERRFPLNPAGIQYALGTGVNMAFENGRLFLSLDNVRGALRYIPLNPDSLFRFEASSPLLTVVDEKKGGFRIYYGNRVVTKLSTFPVIFDKSIKSIAIEVDGELKQVPFGSIVQVTSHFTVQPTPGYRVNAIGATIKGAPAKASECGVRWQKKDFIPAFSLDKSGTLFRVEVYRTRDERPEAKGKDVFAGMILMRFGKAPETASLLPDKSGRENRLGR